MPKREIERYREILNQILASTERRPRLTDEPVAHPDVNDLAAANHACYISDVKETIQVSVYDAARRALERLDEGEYGVCEECGEPINPKRLAAVPWTDCCVGCQTERESGCGLGRAA